MAKHQDMRENELLNYTTGAVLSNYCPERLLLPQLMGSPKQLVIPATASAEQLNCHCSPLPPDTLIKAERRSQSQLFRPTNRWDNK